MILKGIHPARKYTNRFVYTLLTGAMSSCVIRKSQPLPVLAEGEPPPEFERFRNRLKIMAELDPVVYPIPRMGSFLISFDRRLGGDLYELMYKVTAQFTDVGDNPQIELRGELIEIKA